MSYRAVEPAGDDDKDEVETPSLLSSEGGKFRGTAVPFNTITRIDDPWDGPFDEQFLPGAFTETLAEKRVTLLFEHGHNPLLHRMPIGSFDRLEETKDGLEFDATPFTNWLTEPLQDAVRAGVISKMSIGFIARDFEIIEQDDDEDTPLVSHSRVDLPEMSIVLWPAYDDTDVQLNSKSIQLPSGPFTDSAANPARGGNVNEGTKTQPRLARAKAILTIQELTQ